MPRHQPLPQERPPAGGERRELRRHFRSRRNGLATATQADHAAAIARHFFAGGLQLRGRTVAAYVANDGELDPRPLVGRLLAANRRVALPVVGRNRTLTFFRYQHDTLLVPNRYGIGEPVPGTAHVHPLSIDVLLMPLVAFDDFGVRLGMGAGYYDRFLSRLPARLRPRLIGLAHEVQRSRDPLPFADWDVPLDGVVTEAGWQTFT